LDALDKWSDRLRIKRLLKSKIYEERLEGLNAISKNEIALKDFIVSSKYGVLKGIHLGY